MSIGKGPERTEESYQYSRGLSSGTHVSGHYVIMRTKNMGINHSPTSRLRGAGARQNGGDRLRIVSHPVAWVIQGGPRKPYAR